MIQIIQPSLTKENIGENTTNFTIDSLERGFGYTFGNSLRRVLMSSLTGAAVTSIKIDGEHHEFSTIKGLREDVIELLLNLKGLVLRSHSKEPVTIKLNVKGPKEVRAEDIKTTADVEIVNPDLYIATLNKQGQLNIEMTVENGRGYVTAERNKKPNMPIGTIAVDSTFSPVKRVTYKVENTRVGQRTDYDKLILTIETNGSIEPEEAMTKASKIISEHLNLFIDEVDKESESIFMATDKPSTELLSKPIEDLDFTVRSYNCLKKAGIQTLGELTETRKEDLMAIRNFGQKSIDEIEDKLKEIGLSLGGGEQ